MTTRKQHDQWYKKLFSNPILLQHLITGFVKEDFVGDLDFSSMKRLDKSFISDDYQERESDVIYEIRYKRKRAYIYLLLEFQSTVDWFMALRMLSYITQFYLMLIEGRKMTRLPPVFPVLLYNGSKKWHAPVSFRELVEPFPVGDYIPDFRYYKIAENEFSRRELLAVRNAVSALFLIENCTSSTFSDTAKILFDLLGNEGRREVELFFNWALAYLKDEKYVENESLIKIKNLQEAESMWATTVKKYGDGFFRKGLRKGKLEGMREGIVETEGKIVRSLFSAGMSKQEIAKKANLSITRIDAILEDYGCALQEPRAVYKTARRKKAQKP